MHTKYLLLDSRTASNRATDVTNGGRCTFHLTTPIRDVTCVSLSSACIPHSFYTLDDGSTFSLTHSGSTTTVSLDSGIYSLALLAGHIQTQINVASFTCTASTTTLRLQFAFTGPFSIQVSDEKVAAVMGFAVNTVHQSAANALLSTSVCELAPPMLSVTSQQLRSNYVSGTGTELPAVFTVPIDQNAGSMMVYNEHSHYTQKKKYSQPISLSQLDIELRDQFGTILNMNGLPWTFVLAIESRN